MELTLQNAINFLEVNIPWLSLVIIPISAALIGWLTNVIAIWMTFYPLQFTGLGKVGWQGIVPSHAGKMAALSVDLMVGKLVNLKDIFGKIKPEYIAEKTYPLLKVVSDEVMDKVLSEKMPFPWYFFSDNIKDEFYKEGSKEIPYAVQSTMKDIQENIETLFDIKSMVIEQLENDKTLLNEIFLKCGEEEFKFLERSGLYFGFCFGLMQMVLWYFIQDLPFSWLILPIGGLLVGYLTNWLALKLIFKPQQPIKIGFWTIQGLFLKRQKAVSETYANIVATKILTTKKIFFSILNGKEKETLDKIIENNVSEAVDNSVKSFRSIIQLLMGRKAFESLKQTIYKAFKAILPEIVAATFDYADEVLDMEKTLNDKMSGLSSAEFEGFLHPVFQEDELKLILVGAVLGMFAGFLQMLFLW
ncbi:MAG: uncharacterized membrane protein YheB (UPF0754 family) [Saprospiraceae bacterium]|jgi:uncharacterized membrane protein YheB (UPF0754 family)